MYQIPSDTALIALYGENALSAQKGRYMQLCAEFKHFFGDKTLRYFSAPGRSEVCGNHTDHNRGKVLAAAVNVDSVCAVAENGQNIIRLYTDIAPDMVTIELDKLAPVAEEEGTTASLIRGVCAKFASLGYALRGFDACVTSTVKIGSGLSSSASFEVLIAAVLDGLFGKGEMPQAQRAQIGQYAENVFFGKPCGLMDQTACAVGGFVGIDFEKDDAVIEAVNFDIDRHGYSLVIVDSGSSHDDLTAQYASIPAEMKAVAACFGKAVLREVDETEFYASLGELKTKVSERAVLRAMHFFEENKRVDKARKALEEDNIEAFFAAINESGMSSWTMLQNIFPQGDSQPLALALAISKRVLGGRGACRVHGGGFAGTIQAFVPKDLMNEYVKTLEGVYGEGACTVLKVRAQGSTEVDA